MFAFCHSVHRYSSVTETVSEPESSGWMSGKTSSLKKWCCSGTAARGGGGGVTIPGDVQEPWRCGSEGWGQWAQWGGLGLDVGI